MSATSDNECDIDVEKMLFEVRKRPCLYDTGSEEFHNSNMKENAWNGIGNILGTSGKDTFFSPFTLILSLRNPFAIRLILC